MRAALAIAVIVSSFGCKTDDAKPAATVSSRPGPAATGSAVRFEVDQVLLVEPTFRSSTPLAPLKRIDEREQARQSWCMTGSDARAIANEMATQLTATGWREVTTNGTPERAGLSAVQDSVRLSITIGGRDQACTGVVATAMYTGSTITIPPLEEGERIH